MFGCYLVEEIEHETGHMRLEVIQCQGRTTELNQAQVNIACNYCPPSIRLFKRDGCPKSFCMLVVEQIERDCYILYRAILTLEAHLEF